MRVVVECQMCIVYMRRVYVMRDVMCVMWYAVCVMCESGVCGLSYSNGLRHSADPQMESELATIVEVS